MKHTLFLSIICTGILLSYHYFTLGSVEAQVRQSGSYQIQSDSLNFGGGRSTSTNFIQESTAGEIATGESSSVSFNLYAGYQQMQEVFIAITGASDVTLLPSLGGVTGGVATGSTTVTVTTDSTSGYQMTIEASGSPAMQSTFDSIDNYSPAGAVPDFTFNYGPNEAFFGYTPEGSDVAQRFLDNGTDTCGVGATETNNRCWDALTTTATTIATAADANHPNGATTTIAFRIGIGSAAPKIAGTYYATTTITALPL